MERQGKGREGREATASFTVSHYVVINLYYKRFRKKEKKTEHGRYDKAYEKKGRKKDRRKRTDRIRTVLKRNVRSVN